MPLDEGFWTEAPLGTGVRRQVEDANGLVALDKPEGTLSHPNTPKDEERSLLRAAYDPRDESYSWRAGGVERRLWLINRLDSATSGLIMASTDGRLAREVRSQFQKRRVHKVYQALVFGVPRRPAEDWRDRLAVEKSHGQIRTRASAGHIPAECRMTLVRMVPGTPRLALLLLEPKTGRSHQLRVQCAKRGLPIVGDRTYGNFTANRAFAKDRGHKRLFLHSLSISFDYAFAGGTHHFSAACDLPEEFSA